MTVVRAYANLAPPRYQRPLDLLQMVLAGAFMAALVGEYLLGVSRLWLDATLDLFFMALGLNWFLWPNRPVSNPFATRLLGGLLFAACLTQLVKFAFHHLI